MLLKKNTKLAIGLLFLFNLKLDLQAIDERLWEELHSPVPETVSAEIGIVSAFAKVVEDKVAEDSDSDSSSSREYASMVDQHLNDHISGLVAWHMRDDSTDSSSSVVDMTAERASEVVPDLTRSAPAVTLHSPEDLELSFLDGDPRGVQEWPCDSFVKVRNMGSLVAWQARLTSSSTHTDYRRPTSPATTAAIVAAIVATTYRGNAFTKADHSGSADGSGPRGRS